MTTLQQQIISLQQQILREDYYTLLYSKTLAKHDMMPIGICHVEYSDAKIIDMCNDFWLDLPDTPEIRREPFFLLCDIAEHVFW